MRSFTIAGRTITDASPAYVISELSHNHQGSVQMAREMMRVSKDCGADAVKLQKRSPAFYSFLRAKGLTEYAYLREERELSDWDYMILRDEAHRLGLSFIATAFDTYALDFLQRVAVDALKLASGAVHTQALLDATAKTGLPIILSTGCCDLADVDRAWSALTVAHDNLALLQCTSSYPTADADMNLLTIPAFRAHYPATVVGLSSHHPTNQHEPVAYALGARIFEKHFTLSRDLGPGDHANSLDPAGLRDLVAKLRSVEAALGSGEKRFLPCEEEGRRRLDVNFGKEA